MTQDPDTLRTELTQANAAYREAKARADEIRNQLTTAVMNAYQGGVIKADILRAINHEWSRQWLDEVLRDVPPPRPRKKAPTRKRT